MRTIDDTSRDQRFLMVTHRLSRALWENECYAVRSFLANPPDSIGKLNADKMLAIIARPLPTTHHAFAIIHCYADIPALTHWNTTFAPSRVDRHEETNAILQFGVFWRRMVLPSLEAGHHQIAVIEFPVGLPKLLGALPDDPDDKASSYIGMCSSEDFPDIQRQLAKKA